MDILNHSITIILNLRSLNVFPPELIWIICDTYLDLHPKFVMISSICDKCKECNQMINHYDKIKNHISKLYPKRIRFHTLTIQSHSEKMLDNYRIITSFSETPIRHILICEESFQGNLDFYHYIYFVECRLMNAEWYMPLYKSDLKHNLEYNRLYYRTIYDILSSDDCIK